MQQLELSIPSAGDIAAGAVVFSTQHAHAQEGKVSTVSAGSHARGQVPCSTHIFCNKKINAAFRI